MLGKDVQQQLAIYHMVSSLLQSGDYYNVIRFANAAIEMGIVTDVVYTVRGYAHCNRGNYGAALNDHNQALDLSSRSKTDLAMPLTNRAHCYRQQGNLDAAIQDCDKAIEIVNQRPHGSEGNETILVDAYMNRGLAHSIKGEHSQALADCEQALSYARTAKPATQSFVYADRGSVLGAQGDYDAAMTDFDRALRLAESRPYATAWAYWRRGLVRSKQNNQVGAISDFTAAIEACPQLVDPYRSRADQYKAIGDTERANADYKMVAELRNDPLDAIDPEILRREVNALIKRPINKNMAAVALILGVITLALLAVIISQLR